MYGYFRYIGRHGRIVQPGIQLSRSDDSPQWNRTVRHTFPSKVADEETAAKTNGASIAVKVTNLKTLLH